MVIKNPTQPQLCKLNYYIMALLTGLITLCAGIALFFLYKKYQKEKHQVLLLNQQLLQKQTALNEAKAEADVLQLEIEFTKKVYRERLIKMDQLYTNANERKAV